MRYDYTACCTIGARGRATGHSGCRIAFCSYNAIRRDHKSTTIGPHGRNRAYCALCGALITLLRAHRPHSSVPYTVRSVDVCLCGAGMLLPCSASARGWRQAERTNDYEIQHENRLVVRPGARAGRRGGRSSVRKAQTQLYCIQGLGR